ncbi:glycine--tRNA ligase subunit beta [Desulfonatronovibrio hydrogenovorans]|uniref:glycine--tRNA ligase subunit beta n=1 Tax=Desulfonatronovibrio hydrogenovorans TaxID=53245 RepID=UPI00048BC301|nr:glycine--tRNA ligase subunit beta [Desulfonatronovibrio hydrogenovorans]
MSDFVLEIGFEEMPARFLPVLTRNLKVSFMALLDREMIKYQKVESYSTPRRLSVHAYAVSAVQEKKEELVTGPPVSIAFDAQNSLTKAGIGFARSQQVDVSDLFRHPTEKGEYLAVKKIIGGKKTLKVLPDICAQAVNGLVFPKKMRWADSFTFGRPIRWILALFDDQPVDFSISDIQSGSVTFGHRVLGPGPWEVGHASEYFDILSGQGKVVLDPEKRKEMISTDTAGLAAEIGGNVVENQGLIKETSYLVEFPKVVLGGYDRKYLELPREVLLTSMETHQKSFGLADEAGNLLPYFLTVINNDPLDLDLVRKGWERVLKARLEDAMFFWNADRAITAEERLKMLDRVVFLASLGTMGDKSRRLEKISGFICDDLGESRKADIRKAALICKSDLVSEMVGEFPDLQGIMGGIYSSLEGYGQDISKAVYDHYLPLGPDSPLPSDIAGAIVSLADKADNLTGCFGLNLIPTGAADPYALRRQALGMIRIILDQGLDIDLRKLFHFCSRSYSGVKWKLDLYQAQESLLQFMSARLKSLWQGRGVDGKIVDAVIQAGSENILVAEKRLDSLLRFSTHPDFEAAVLTFKRIDNIVRKQGREDGVELQDDFNPELLQDAQEVALGRHIQEVVKDWDEQWNRKEFDLLFARLHELRPLIDDFFDGVMVMCDDQNLRQNRLNMLNTLSKRLGSLADFSALQV